MNVGTMHLPTARRSPLKVAVIMNDRKITYGELERLTNRMASSLTASGYQRGDVVAVDLHSTPELVVSYLGIMKAGLVANVINAHLKGGEVKYIINDSASVGIITDMEHRPMMEGVVKETPSVKRLLITDGEEGDADSLASFLQKGEEKFRPADCDPRDVANLLYTSGTTGFPKGVMLTHLNVMDNAANFADIHYIGDDVILVGAPLFHCWGLINGVLGMLHARGTAILVERFKTERVIEDIEKRRPTIFQGVPTMLNYIVRYPGVEERDLSSLRFVLSAAASMPVELIKVLEEGFGIRYAEAYGLTEVSPVITTAPFARTRHGSCGYAMGNTELKVVDADNRALPPGEVGELCCRGTAVMKGYLNKPEATREVIDPDGWFHTGDIVRMDDDGYVYIVDRKKDMINYAGEKIYPREVEEVLHTHPGIRDAAVVGVPDPVKGELVKAFIVPTEGVKLSTEEVAEYCRERMASFKVPRVLEFADEIPRSASGKILRRILRE